MIAIECFSDELKIHDENGRVMYLSKEEVIFLSAYFAGWLHESAELDPKD